MYLALLLAHCLLSACSPDPVAPIEEADSDPTTGVEGNTIEDAEPDSEMDAESDAEPSSAPDAEADAESDSEADMEGTRSSAEQVAIGSYPPMTKGLHLASVEDRIASGCVLPDRLLLHSSRRVPRHERHKAKHADAPGDSRKEPQFV